MLVEESIIVIVVVMAFVVKVVNCFELNSELGSSVSLLDTGLTALGSLGVLGTTLLRGRLDVEHPMRDIWSLKPAPVLDAAILTTNSIWNSVVLIILDSEVKGSVQVLLDTLTATTGLAYCIVYVQTGSRIHGFQASCSGGNHSCECIALPRLHAGQLEEEEEELQMLWQLVHPTGLVWTDHNGGTAYQLCSECMDNACHANETRDMPLCRPVNVDWKGITSRIEGNVIGEFWSYNDMTDRALHQNGGIIVSGYSDGNTEFFRYLGENMVIKDRKERLVRSVEEDLLLNPSSRAADADYGSLITTPNIPVAARVVEIVAMAALTLFFRVDPLSSGLVARRLVRSYLVGSAGNTYALQGLVKRLWFGHSIIRSSSQLHVVGFEMAWKTKGQALMQAYFSVVGAFSVAVVWCLSIIFDYSAFGFATMYGQVTHHLLRYGLLITSAILALSIWGLPYLRYSFTPKLMKPSHILLAGTVVACSVVAGLDYKFEFLALPKVAFPLSYVLVLSCWLGGTRLLGRNVSKMPEFNEVIILPYCCSYLANFWMIASGGKWRVFKAKLWTIVGRGNPLILAPLPGIHI